MQDRVTVVVDNRVRLVLDAVPQKVADELMSGCCHDNPQYHKLRSMGFKAWKERPIIRTWKQEGAELTLPRGRMQLIRDVLQAHGISWTVVDQRVAGDRDLTSWRGIPPMTRELWPHQVEAVDALLRVENCLVRAPTGSGKTEVLIGAIVRAQLPALVVVWESGLLKQWQDRLRLVLGLSGRDVGLVRGKAFRLRPVTLAMQQTLNRLPEERWAVLQRAFGLVGCEEVSRWAARTFTGVVDRFPARYRVGISADETRKDRKEFLIHDMFGRAAIEISKDRLVDEGYVHDVEVRIVPTEFEADWYREAAESDEQVADFGRLLEEMTADEDRNTIAADVAAGHVRSGQQVLIFSHRVEHCRVLDAEMTARGCRSGLIAGDDAERCERTKDGLRSGERDVGVGTFARIALGVDLPSVDVGVVATPIHNNRQFVGQVAGRLCRSAEGKSGATLYYLWDRWVSGKRALLNLKRWNRTVVVYHRDGLLAEWLPVKRYLKEVYDAEEERGGRDEGGAERLPFVSPAR